MNLPFFTQQKNGVGRRFWFGVFAAYDIFKVEVVLAQDGIHRFAGIAG